MHAGRALLGGNGSPQRAQVVVHHQIGCVARVVGHRLDLDHVARGDRQRGWLIAIDVTPVTGVGRRPEQVHRFFSRHANTLRVECFAFVSRCTVLLGAPVLQGAPSVQSTGHLALSGRPERAVIDSPICCARAHSASSSIVVQRYPSTRIRPSTSTVCTPRPSADHTN